MDFVRFAYGIREAAAVLVILIIFPLVVDKGTKVFIGKPAEVITAEEHMKKNDEHRHILYRELRDAKEDSAEAKDIKNQLEQTDDDHAEQRNIIEKWNESIQSTRFYVALVVGLLAIIVGVIIDVPSLGTGLVLGGGFVISRGYWDYWSFISDAFAFASLLLVLFSIAGALWGYSRKRTV